MASSRPTSQIVGGDYVPEDHNEPGLAFSYSVDDSRVEFLSICVHNFKLGPNNLYIKG